MSDMPSQTERRGPLFHLRHNSRLIITTLALALCAFTFGYDGTVIGGVLAVPAFIVQYSHTMSATGPILTATDISIMTAIPISGSLFGAAIVGYSADKFGRKMTLFVGCVLSLVGAVLQTAASHIALFTVGRVFASTSVFVLVATSVAFSNEVSPAPVRGALGATSIVGVNMGAMLSSGISYGTWQFPDSRAYRIPIGMQCLWPFIIAAGVAYVMDSPTSYLIKGDDERAEQSLRKVRKGYTELELVQEMTALKMQESLRAEEKMIPWTALFKGPNLRRTLLAGFVGNVQVLSGLFYSTSYATIFLTQIGSADPFLLVFALSILSFGGAIAGLLVVDWIGRRTLALTSFTIIFVIDLVIGTMGCLDLTESAIGKTLAAFFLLFGFFYAAGFGPLTYVNPAEFPTARLRNKTSAFVFLIQSLNSLVCLYVYPYITNADAGNLGAKVYLFFAGCMAAIIAITYFVFPELKGRTAAEVDEMFEARVPARKFSGYRCSTAPEVIEQALGSRKNSLVKEREEQLEMVDA